MCTKTSTTTSTKTSRITLSAMTSAMTFSGRLASTALAIGLVLGISGTADAGTREQAKRMHDRLAGVPPIDIAAATPDAVLNCMQLMIEGNNTDPATNDCPDTNFDNDAEGAARLAMENPDFYRVTLKNFITPWTNEEQTVFAPLNDYTATVIGIIRDDIDFRSILTDDILYVGNGITPAYSETSNAHYEAMEDANTDLKTVLQQTTQSGTYSLASGTFPSSAAAGVMTTRQGAKAFFIDGTNRAMFRFTLLNHLCTDLEQIKDNSRAHDRIRQDVSRSPGGDSRIYMNACSGCHSGMDPLAQAYAYYNYAYDADTDPDAENGQLEYTAGVVQPKYHINANNFEYGFYTEDDTWTNYWREGPNSVLGWTGNTTGDFVSGSGASSMGAELANSEAFARCQVEKVFQAVCLRAPVDAADRSQIDSMDTAFKGSGYQLKKVFAQSAVFCKGD